MNQNNYFSKTFSLRFNLINYGNLSVRVGIEAFFEKIRSLPKMADIVLYNLIRDLI